MRTFDTTTPVTTILDIPAGEFRFIAADRADATVEVRPTDPGRSRDVKVAEQTEIGYADGILRITAPEPRSRILGPSSGSVEVTVQLPAGSRIEAKTADADVRGVGRLGEVVIESARAAVKIDEAADTEVTIQAGSVSVGRLTGSARISTVQGDLRVDEATRGTVTLRTSMGGISVGVAHGVRAALDAGTNVGRIRNTLTNPAGTPALTIHATTAYGDIDARSL